MKQQRKLPRDFSQRAKAIVDLTTGATTPEPLPEKNPAAVALSKLGAAKGGRARAEKLSAEQKKAIAEKAAKARWSKKSASE
jgi:hypothetical protein